MRLKITATCVIEVDERNCFGRDPKETTQEQFDGGDLCICDFNSTFKVEETDENPS